MYENSVLFVYIKSAFAKLKFLIDLRFSNKFFLYCSNITQDNSKQESFVRRTKTDKMVQKFKCQIRYQYTTFLSIIFIYFRYCQAICPNETVILPCTCNDEGLQCLSLNNTGLERVFNAFSERKAIRRVWIFQTNLTKIKTKAFGDYIIRDLYLDLNKISHIETNAFGLASSTLQTLSLTRNLLKTFPYKELNSFVKLKQLALSHNLITEIPTYAFPHSSTLESLDLSHNKIRKIEPFAFSNLNELSLIDLSRNHIQILEKNSLVIKTNSKNLAVSIIKFRIVIIFIILTNFYVFFLILDSHLFQDFIERKLFK